jgi:8-amino-7-oxononanoate synthase
VISALREGAERYGAGSGASHLVSGHSRAHALLEERFGEWLSPYIENARALYLCTGYMANLAVLTALGADADATIFSEALNHASLIDGARLARAGVSVYPHGDVEALEQQLSASTSGTKIVVTDSVFSMDGNLAPLPQLLALCERHGAWLVVDDAHGFGVLGESGRGALEHFGLRSPNLVYIGTLGKAAGVGGAFIAAHASVIELLVQRARPYIYTTAAPPALAHALQASLDIIGGEEGIQRRAHLAALVEHLRDALRVAAGLHEQGLWVPAIRPPTVAPGTSRLRVTLSAAHSHEEVATLARALNELERATA